MGLLDGQVVLAETVGRPGAALGHAGIYVAPNDRRQSQQCLAGGQAR